MARQTFEQGKSYRVTLELSGLAAVFAGAPEVREEIWGELGIDSDVRDLGGGRFEALGTWPHPTRTVDLPDEVVSVAELPSAAPPEGGAPRVTIGEAVIESVGEPTVSPSAPAGLTRDALVAGLVLAAAWFLFVR